jgi:AraC-like DNA-binding protein
MGIKIHTENGYIALVFMLKLSHFSPSSALSKVVQRYYVVEGTIPEGTEWHNKLLPSIMQSILFCMNGSSQRSIINGQEKEIQFPVILGQFTTHFESIARGELYYIGVHFTPTGLWQVLQTPLQKYSNNVVGLKSIIGERANVLAKKLQSLATLEEKIDGIENFLHEQLRQEAEVRELAKIEKVTELLLQHNGNISLKEIIKEVGFSERNLQRYFLEYVGVTPKQFAKITRFNAVTKLLEEKQVLNWQDIFHKVGFFDQAHFIKDFKDITGLCPSVYFASKTYYEHFFYGV